MSYYYMKNNETFGKLLNFAKILRFYLSSEILPFPIRDMENW